MKLLTRQHSQQIEYFGFSLSINCLQSECISCKLLKFLLCYRNVHCGFRSAGKGISRSEFGKNGVIGSECCDKAICNCASLDYLNSQSMVFDQVEARQHCMIDRQHPLRYRKINAEDLSWNDVFYVLADSIFNQLETNLKFSANTQKQPMQRIRLGTGFTLFVHAILIRGKGYCYPYGSYGAYCSDPIRPFGSSHFASILADCAPRDPERKSTANQGDCNNANKNAQPYAQKHYPSNQSWRNRNTQSIGGGK